MTRALLTYQGGAIELPAGETIVGRAVECRIRFNDASVSRRHLRFRLSGGSVVIEDLGSANGTRVNGELIETPRALVDKDVIQIGNRVLELTIETEAAGRSDPNLETKKHSTLEDPTERQPAEITCPSCRTFIPASSERCPSCGHAVLGRWHSKTQIFDPAELEAADRERRLGQRYETTTPVLYASENLSIDAEAHNLSLSGVFVATDLFDDVGSPCRVTLLPDGGAPVHLGGMVRRIVVGDDGSAPGMGIEFTSMPPSTEKWLLDYLQRQPH